MLDEPTNNLDASGIDVLTVIIHTVAKTCVVISHDEDFLNSFTDSVLYLDIHSKKVEQYDGDYHTVKSEIIQRIKRENSINARLLKEAQAKKDQANAFANKVYCC
jgi:ATP-binding cassette subfamily F protein 3